MEALASPELWAALFTLTALEIVLGIDNVIFLSIIAGKLPKEQQARARTLGLAGALVTRVLLLFSLAWLAGLTEPMITVAGFGASGRDMVLFFGGLFLLYKAGTEILEMLSGHPAAGEAGSKIKAPSFVSAIVQIMILDIVFSLDSVITAVGMTQNLPVMVTAITIAIITMMFFAGPLAAFVDRHPTVKMLALAFLIMIGLVLIVDGVHIHVPKAYVYVAMAFSVAVELLNLRLRHKLEHPATPSRHH
ncbi:TerC family protein [Hydrocarboniphaga sp.]|uniref:TerC family protein n=1 Tax=Hydrocarboniphaga sp. TaxID=2033016 RepID=UPI0034559562